MKDGDRLLLELNRKIWNTSWDLAGIPQLKAAWYRYSDSVTPPPRTVKVEYHQNLPVYLLDVADDRQFAHWCVRIRN